MEYVIELLKEKQQIYKDLIKNDEVVTLPSYESRLSQLTEALDNLTSSSRIISSCEHNNTYQENVKCTLCDDCGDIVETDV